MVDKDVQTLIANANAWLRKKGELMPSRFDAGVFDPELARLMKCALQAAIAKVAVARHDEIAVKHHLAGVIVEIVSLGVRDHEQVVVKALASLASAKLSGEWMIKRDGAS